MLKEQAFANALAVVTLGVYVVCRVLALVASDLLFAIGQSWFHTWNLDAVKSVAPFDLGIFIIGAVTSTALVWITAYAAANLYNRFAAAYAVIQTRAVEVTAPIINIPRSNGATLFTASRFHVWNQL